MVVYLIFPNSGLFEKRLESHSTFYRIIAVELEVFWILIFRDLLIFQGTVHKCQGYGKIKELPPRLDFAVWNRTVHRVKNRPLDYVRERMDTSSL